MLHRIAFPVVSEWYQDERQLLSDGGSDGLPSALHCHSSGRGGRLVPSLHAVKSLKFATARRQISCLPLPPVRKRQPHPASSPDPFATPHPILPLPCPSARRKCERQPRPGSRCLLEYPLFRVGLALLPTAAPPAPLRRGSWRLLIHLDRTVVSCFQRVPQICRKPFDRIALFVRSYLTSAVFP